MDYSFETQVRTGGADISGRANMYWVFSVMQDLADIHGTALGLGRDKLLENNLVWIVARSHVAMSRYPVLSETVVAGTMYGAPTRIGFHRYYSITSQGGEVLGRASNLWLLADKDSHRFVSPKSLGMAFPDEDIVQAERLDTNKLAFDGQPISTTKRRPVYSDYDINGHVNNARYVQWICDILPMERLLATPICRMELNYTAEVKQGEEVLLELAEKENGFCVRGSSDSEVKFIADGDWASEA